MSENQKLLFIISAIIIVVIIWPFDCNCNNLKENYSNINEPNKMYKPYSLKLQKNSNNNDKDIKDDSRVLEKNIKPFFYPEKNSLQSGVDYKKVHIAPAWENVNTVEHDETEEDYDNDTRLIYNKCSLSCCSPQYPVPFDTEIDKEACDRTKNLPSSYGCTNSIGGTGCLCITPEQAKILSTS